MDIQRALTVARDDAARLLRYMDRRERFLDALDWSLLPPHAGAGERDAG